MQDNDVNTEAIQIKIIWDRKMQHRRIWDKSGKAWIEWISSKTPAITNIMKHIFEKTTCTCLQILMLVRSSNMCGIWKAGEATSCISGSCSLAFPGPALSRTLIKHNPIISHCIGLDFGKQNNSTIPDCQNCFQPLFFNLFWMKWFIDLPANPSATIQSNPAAIITSYVAKCHFWKSSLQIIIIIITTNY